MNRISLSLLILSTLAVLSKANVPEDPSHRIVGGRRARIEEVPYQVGLVNNGSFANCGGTIIAKRFVLTAAHCFNLATPYDKISVRMGSDNAYRGGRMVNVKKVMIHEDYDKKIENDFDFALLELEEDIKFDKTVKPMGLPKANHVLPVGYPMRISGWGDTMNVNESTSFLRTVLVPKVSQEDCARAYDPSAKITDRMLCGGFRKGGKDACQGDSGGPLVHEKMLVGVVSWGYDCASPKYPGVYSRVASVIPWLEARMNTTQGTKIAS